MRRANDLSALLLLYSSLGNVAGIETLAKQATATGKHNVSFVCLFLLGQLDECINLLVSTKRLPEAAFFARTYAPRYAENFSLSFFSSAMKVM